MIVPLQEAKRQYERIMSRPLNFKEKIERYHEATKESLGKDDYMDFIGTRFLEGGPGSGRHPGPALIGLTPDQRKALKSVPASHLEKLGEIKTGKMDQMGSSGKWALRAYYSPREREEIKGGDGKPKIHLSKGAKGFDLLHELGHHVFYEHLTPRDRAEWNSGKLGSSPSPYIYPNPRNEQFAEAYALLMSGKTSHPDGNEKDNRGVTKALDSIKKILDKRLKESAFKEHGVLGQKWGITHEKDVAGKRDISSWSKVGEKQGSNEGGTFKSPLGIKYYVKFYANTEQGKSEVLANKIYESLGIPAPESELVTLNGKEGVASLIIPGTATSRDQQSGSMDIQKGFVADAFLANHDVVGLTHDNIIRTGDDVFVRIDNGGSMFFRARGKPKEFDKGSVPELSTMRNAQIAKQAGYVFAPNITKNRIQQQSEHLINTLSNEKIRNLVHEAGFKGADAEKYSTALIGRKDVIGAYAKEPATIPPMPKEKEPPAKYIQGVTQPKDTTPPPPTYLKPESGVSYQDQAHQFVADFVKKSGLPAVLLPKENTAHGAHLIWDPANNKRQALFKEAGIDSNSYQRFHQDIHSWIHGNYKGSITAAAKEIIDSDKTSQKNPHPTPLAQCLLVENGINKAFYSSSNLKRTTTQLYRGLKSDVAQQAAKAKKAGADGFVYQPRSVESFTTNLKKATKDFAGEGGIVLHDAVPVKNILVSYRTNGIFRASNFEVEKEHIVLMPDGAKTIPFTKQGGIRVITKMPKKYQSGYVKPKKISPTLKKDVDDVVDSVQNVKSPHADFFANKKED